MLIYYIDILFDLILLRGSRIGTHIIINLYYTYVHNLLEITKLY